jgi:UDP-N-acetylglucosamine acyltransferase
VKIHPLAVVSSTARIGRDVEIGPFAIVEDGATIGDGCILESSVVVKEGSTLGPNNHLFEGTIIGGPPQHAHMPERPGRVTIGAGNTLREFVTVHRAMDEAAITVIGDNNLLMAGVHVAHDCRVGSNTIFTNYALLAGHVTVDDRAYVSAGVGVHQFCRIGSLAMVGGHAAVTKDVPPFVTVDGQTGLVVGLNQVGLRRAGYSSREVEQLKVAYRLVYRSGLPWLEMLGRLRAEFTEGAAGQFYPFIAATKRGIAQERRMPPGATIKLRRAVDDDQQEERQLRAKAS